MEEYHKPATLRVFQDVNIIGNIFELLNLKSIISGRQINKACRDASKEVCIIIYSKLIVQNLMVPESLLNNIMTIIQCPDEVSISQIIVKNIFRSINGTVLQSKFRLPLFLRKLLFELRIQYHIPTTISISLDHWQGIILHISSILNGGYYYTIKDMINDDCDANNFKINSHISNQISFYSNINKLNVENFSLLSDQRFVLVNREDIFQLRSQLTTVFQNDSDHLELIIIDNLGQHSHYSPQFNDEYWVSRLPDNIKTMSIVGANLSNIGSNFLSQCINVNSLTLPYGITIIGDNFLRSCHNILSVTIPETVTSIGHKFLFRCFSLPKILLPSNMKVIRDSFCQDCTNLTTLIIPKNVTTIGDNFLYGCTRLSTITISSNNLRTIGNNFLSKCTSLYEICLPYGLMTIGNDFLRGCNSLNMVTIPSSVITIGEGFLFNCMNIKTVKLPIKFKVIGDRLLASTSNGISVLYEENQYSSYDIGKYSSLSASSTPPSQLIQSKSSLLVINENQIKKKSNRFSLLTSFFKK